MALISNITGKELIKVIKYLGYKLERQNKGNHRIFTHPNKPTIIIPAYKKKQVKIGLLLGILKTIGISKNDFLKLLKSI